MEPKSPKDRRKRWAIVLASVLGLASVGWIAIEVNVQRRWKAMETRVGELVREVQAMDGRRPIACGEAQPGNAWDDYAAAMEEISSRPVTSMDGFKRFLGRAAGADPDYVGREVAALEKAIDHLLCGARKAQARPALRWEGESVLPHSGEGLIRRLGEITVCKARLLRARDSHAAIELLFGSAQFARDAASGTSCEVEWEALAALGMSLDEMTDLVASRTLKGDDLALLERGLKTLDETFPRDGRPALNDVAFQGTFLLRHDPFFPADETYRKPRPILPGWRHAFSMKLFKADAFERWHAVAQAHTGAATKAWDEAKGIFDANVNILERDPENRILNRLPPPALEAIRSREAQLRLLRTAVHFVRHGTIDPEVDPFGPMKATLLSKIEGNRLRVWSRGPNGVDDGGEVADRPVSALGSATIIGPSLGLADDIVLEVER